MLNFNRWCGGVWVCGGMGCVDVCLDRLQTEEVFKIHTYKSRTFAKRRSKRGVFVQSEDCNSMRNLTLYV